MKVVFCFHTNDHEFNIGIAFLSAALKQRNVDTDVVIYREIEGKQKDRPEEIVERLLAKGPRIIAFSIMTFNWARLKKVIILLRPRFDGVIIAGGYHAILCPDEVLSFPGIDAVCVGEGEQPLTKVVEFYRQHPSSETPSIPGMRFKKASRHLNQRVDPWLLERLEDYPYMDYDIFLREGNRPLREKFIGSLCAGGIFSLSVVAGRGCPFQCAYCCNSALLKLYGGARRYVRRYPVPVVLSLVKQIAHSYQPEFLEFLDETFTLNRSWTREFCEGYASSIGLPFSVMTRIDRLDDDSIRRMVESGLKLVFFGLESGDEDYRTRFLNRHMSNDLIKKGARLLRKYDVIIVTFNIFGMPFETEDTMAATIALNEAIEPDAAIPFIYQPLPNTKLAEIAYKHHMALPPSEERWDFCSPALDTPELPASYVVEQVETFRSRFSYSGKVEDVYERLRTCVSRGPKYVAAG